ncbi:MAG: hypothetical protein B7Z77_02720 [Acidocella sp. 20-58-15]|nr:MAG: hypothetical protein B7Z77_02720 [Acidocella sp. 20-58-15]
MATWSGGNGDWLSSGTNPGWGTAPPGTGTSTYYTAIINNGATVTVGAVDSITNGFPNLVVGKTASDGGTSGTLIVNGTITGINSAEVGANGTVTVNAGGNFGDGQTLTIDQGGVFSVNGNATTTATASISSGITVAGTFTVGKYSTVTDGSGLAVSSTATVNIYGTFVPGSTGISGTGGTVTVDGGTLGSLASGLNMASGTTTNIVMTNGGTVYLNGSSPAGTFSFGSGNGNSLIFTSYQNTINTPITNFGSGDTIQFLGNQTTFTGVSVTKGTGQPAGTYTVTMVNQYNPIVLSDVTFSASITSQITQSSNGTYNVPGVTDSQIGTSGYYQLGGCFLPGSLIATPSGDIAVESLQPGDLVTTLEAGQPVAKTVKWIGYRHVKAGDLSGDDAHPVRIKAGAFGENTPARDLLITNEHCVVVAGQLTPVRLLVNGRSIIVDKNINDFTYYHVELDEHGILLAEGLAVESYLESGNRSNFANAEVTALRPQMGITVKTANHAQPVLPLLVDPAGLHPVWEALNERAVTLGLAKVSAEPTLTHDADIYIITATGAVLYPTHQHDGKVVFALPDGATGLLLASRTARPCDVTAPYIDDRRELGLSIGEIAVHAGTSSLRTMAHLTMPELAGWHAVEGPGYRWTNGLAALPIDGLTNGAAATLEIQVLRAGPYLAVTTTPDAIAA